jgi:predicted transcriptional regulator
MPHNFGTLPPAQPKRERIFSMRLSDEERDAIEALAQKLNVPDSTLARHFVMEAVTFHSQQTQEDTIDS